jgi:hypothetical protein
MKPLDERSKIAVAATFFVLFFVAVFVMIYLVSNQR